MLAAKRTTHAPAPLVVRSTVIVTDGTAHAGAGPPNLAHRLLVVVADLLANRGELRAIDATWIEIHVHPPSP